MLENTKTQHFQALIDARAAVPFGEFQSEQWVYGECCKTYGRVISSRSWSRWKVRCLTFCDPPGEGLSFPSYVCLWTMARLKRGNSRQKPVKQVSRLRLACAITSALAGVSPLLPEPPENICYSDLKDLAELQALRSYSDRYHREHGLKKSQIYYSRAEALLILSKYPDHRRKNVEPIQA